MFLFLLEDLFCATPEIDGSLNRLNSETIQLQSKMQETKKRECFLRNCSR